jgi:transposase
MARHTGARFSGKRLRELTKQARTTVLADATQGLAVTSSLVVLDCLQPQIKTLETTVHKRVPHTPSYKQRLTVQGMGTILAHTLTLETGAISRFPTVGHSAAYGRCVDSTKSSHGKRTGTGHGKNGNRYVAWASLEAAQCALRLQPEAQRFSHRQLAKSRHNTIVARQAVAHKLARACSDMMRDLVPCEATKACG